MGEAWSDWYAMDFLVNEGFQKDTKAAGDVRIGNYVGCRPGPDPHPAAGLPGRQHVGQVPRHAGCRSRRVHVR